MKKIGIMGTRGIPASYSGFETCVEETAVRFVEAGYNVTVFCRQNHYTERLKTYRGINLVYVKSFRNKHLDTFSSVLFSLRKIMMNRYDILILYGVGNSYFLPILKKYCGKIISVVDGADWERKKWGRFARYFLKNARYFAAKYSDSYVVDNESLAKIYSEAFGKIPVYISYGAKIPKSFSENILREYELEKKKYIIFVGRFVKEKRIEFLIENFKAVNSEYKLVVVGGNDLDEGYELSIKKLGNQRIIFPGFVYENEYESLLRYAAFYVSCSQLEGTSPSLLSAMAINGYALIADIIENRQTIKNTCMTFRVNDSKDFRNKLQFLFENMNFIEQERKKVQKLVMDNYSWDTVAKQYINLF